MQWRGGWLMVLAGAALLGLTACSDGADKAADADPSKLSAELETRAQAIEEKADQAAIAAEQEAGTELASLREEMTAATDGADAQSTADAEGDTSAR